MILRCIKLNLLISSVQSLSHVQLLWPHGLQHFRLSCPSPSPGVCSNSCPLSQWCHPTVSSSVVPFSCPQSFPASGSFLMNQLFASGDQSIGASASASVLLMHIQSWFPLGLTGLIFLLFQESSPTPQFESINSSVLSLLYGPTLTSIHDHWENYSFCNSCSISCLFILLIVSSAVQKLFPLMLPFSQVTINMTTLMESRVGFLEQGQLSVVWISLGFSGMQPVWSPRPHTQGSPALHLMLCSKSCLEVLNFWKGILHFHFISDSAISVAALICIRTRFRPGFRRLDFPGGSDCKESAYNTGDLGSIPGSGRSPGEGNGNPLQYTCLENPTDRGAW